jgi:hypothetical protein
MTNNLTINITGLTIGGLGLVSLIIYFIKKPEKFQILVSLIIKPFSKIFGSLQKGYTKLDLSGRLNNYIKENISQQIPYLQNFRVQVNLVDGYDDPKAFYNEGKIILRLRKDDPEDLNFVHGTYLFVSTSLLFKIKRYISTSQREALDLFVSTKIFEKEKPVVVDHFLENYLHPRIGDSSSKISNYYDKYYRINDGGLFYPVYLEELDFIGKKVYGGRQQDNIIIEVNELIDFLEKVSTRQVGDDDTDLSFSKNYSRMALMIIGKKMKISTSIEPYENFIRKALCPDDIETVYLLGPQYNKTYMEAIATAVGDIYWKHKTKLNDCLIRYEDGSRRKITNIIITLRRIGIELYQPDY